MGERPLFDIESLWDPTISKEIATRNFVVDDYGKKTDVIFNYAGKETSIRSILPIPEVEIEFETIGPFKRVQLGPTTGCYDTETKKVEMFIDKNETESVVNLILLHELSHAYDIQVNPEKYREISEAIIEKAGCYLLQSSYGTVDDIVAKIVKEDDFAASYFNHEQLRSVVRDAETKLTSQNNNVNEYNSYFDFNLLQQQRMATLERSAWYYTLQTIRTLDRQGIPVYASDKEEVIDFAEDKLFTYQCEAKRILRGKNVPIFSKTFQMSTKFKNPQG